ncbi:BAI1-associated protein 3-like isoform X1 [Daphnia pulicaria]|uniref:BAI1-associated protein 3-like isoform X1 n=1 Tax=Daphnia pulicaria TaxID=35523 RepID=UPI001EEC03E8|nr:BAI1-associated protein 3-like isoform X1 [Daphnia pulicaria]
MSFFNTLQQYVSNSVASLNISPRRFSRDNEEKAGSSGDNPILPPPHPPPLTMKMPVPTMSREAGSRSPSTVHRSSAHLLQERSKSLKAVSSQSQPPSPRKAVGGRTASLKESSTLSITVPTASGSGGGPISPSSSTAPTSAAVHSSSPVLSPHHTTGKRREPKLLPTFALLEGTRRTSWPQFAITGSGVQESDGSFFESYTALCWKQENRRLQVLREDDQPLVAQATEGDSQANSAQFISSKEMEQLYVEVLYTIRHKLGAHSAKYPHHFKEDLVHYAQTAFGVGQEYHRRCNAIASEEKPPIVVLNVTVIEAEGLEAKDPNGFSDPYCMLGIQPGCCSGNRGSADQSPQQLIQPPPDVTGSNEELTSSLPSSSSSNDQRRDSLVAMMPVERLKKHSSFRLSFKRKDPGVVTSNVVISAGGNTNQIGPSNRSSLTNASSNTISVIGSNSSNNSNSSSNSCIIHGREQRDSLHAALPAKFIRATSVKGATLNPKWNEKFRFDIDDVCSDTLHLDIWDHDDEYSVLDAVIKLNEVRGVKGLGRFFKQIAQSARSGTQDDFLGCVNIPLQEIPSTGVECWYKLGGRSQRSTIQGRIHLKLWLSTREDLGTSEEDNWTEIKQQEKLHCVFIDFEVSRFKTSPSQWTGELSQAALTILHQHAIQGDVTVLQSNVVRWIAYAGKLPDKSLHFSVLYRILNELDHQWSSFSMEPLSREEEDALAESFTAFIDYSLSCLRKIRYLFSPRLSNSSKLEYLLKCLMQLDVMRAFRRCCPFHKEIRGEIVVAIRKGAAEWFTFELQRCVPSDANLVTAINGLTVLTNRVYADLTRSLQIYDDVFQRIGNVSYFNIVYKSHMKMITHEFSSRLESIRSHFPNGTNGPSISTDGGNGAELGSAENAAPIFELNIALQDLQKFQDHVPPEELPLSHQMAALNCHDCFRVVLEQWLVVARSKALNRVRSAVELDSFTSVEPYLKHSTSAIDTTSCFYQVCDFWKQLSWPEVVSSYPFVYSLVEMITASAIVYADLIFLRIQTHGFFSEDWKMTAVVEEVYVNLNNLQHVKNALASIPQTLNVAAIVAAVDGPSTALLDVQRSPISGRSRSPSVVSGTLASPGYLMIAGGAMPVISGCVGVNSYDNSARQAFHSLLETARDHYENKLLRVAGCLAEKMRSEMKKNIFHLAWSPDSLPANEAAAPLLDCLDHILLDLQPNLLPDAFHRCVAAIWDVLLVELWAQAEVSSGDKFCKFYDRLHSALQMLLNFLHAEGKGLSLEALKCPTYQRVEEKISLHKARTEQLIDLYHVGRLSQQQQLHGSGTIEAPYGVLNIRVYFHHDSLSVEILSARDVIPLDPNGLSDPFVIVELLPRRLFPNCGEQQTTVKRRTLYPVFDECFEFPVTLEQCRQETAMLLFTVMDYDVLTANDFAGEALLSLNTVPGVAAAPQGLDTFHGLKQIDLVLMHQPNKHHPILSVLESRVWDRTAQDFAKKQRERVVS